MSSTSACSGQGQRKPIDTWYSLSAEKKLSSCGSLRVSHRFFSQCFTLLQSSTPSASETAPSSSTAPDEGAVPAACPSVMERAACARREIFELWSELSEQEAGVGQGESGASLLEAEEERRARRHRNDMERHQKLLQLLDKFNMHATVPLEEDVSRGLGDALDRLILMCVPLAVPSRAESLHVSKAEAKHGQATESAERSNGGGPPSSSPAPADNASTVLLERVLRLASRQGRRLTVPLVQHLFARTRSYSESLAIVHVLRCTHFAMNMETYHAMLYSLQRLEEESWAERFREEYLESCAQVEQEGGEAADAEPCTGGLSEQALDFILRGVQSPLMPENKPWLGRIMYGNGEVAPEDGYFASSPTSAKETMKSWDEASRIWIERYKQQRPPSSS